MSTAIQNRFVSTVVNGFRDSRPEQDQNGENVVRWFQDSLFNANVPQADVDSFATGVLSGLHKLKPATNQKRYQFHPPVPREELLKAVFEESFHHAPEIVIVEAQSEDPSQAPFYPLWKRACWIQTPKSTAAFLGNILVKIAFVICVVYFTYVLSKDASNATINFFTAGGPPLEKTSSDFIRTASLGFFAGTSFNIVPLIWTSCNNASAFFGEIVIKTENERLAISKAKAYEVWKKTVTANIPTNRTK